MHRRVFDSNDSALKMAADMPVSAHEMAIAVRTKKAREQKVEGGK